ncbi:MAG: flotillin-like protein FloA [Candidatus Eremiobacteraeota bacterium]|nr:flotillin-like protein FloA [Candidatus Eremiobacteraeota bacterium]
MIGLQIVFFFVPFPLWLSAKLSRVQVGLVDLFVMRTFRKIPPHELVIPAITAQYAGIPISIAKMQSHYMAGGDVQNVVSALIAASKAKIDLNWDTATSIDLAGRNVLEAVQMSVNPKVIQTPLIEAVSHDGIQVKAVCLVTVRANIAKLVGSAGEETVLARVGEGIVTSIGKSRNFKQVLENPDLITEAVLDTGLDSGTAFEILSIDIADIDVGENIGARLQIDQAEADKRVAQAKAEQRRAEAMARQTEMRAKVEEMRAKVVEAQAEVPEALFEALSQGSFTVMDYYKMENMIADTKMRQGLAGGKKSQGGSRNG